MPSVPKRVGDRLSKAIGKFQRILRAAKDHDKNESPLSRRVSSIGLLCWDGIKTARA